MKTPWFVIGGIVLLSGAASGQSVEIEDKKLAAIRKVITNENPQTTVAKVDSERITARRVDIVDSKGVIRMTLAGDVPNPIVDGIEYKRSIPAGGLLIFDEKGNERGGLVYNPIRRSAQLALDYAANDAVGVVSREDGTTEILMNSVAPVMKHPAFGDRRLPLPQGTTRLRMRLSPDGSPEIALADKQEKTRVRLTVTEEGYGAIQFLDATGKIVSTIAPERDAAGQRP